MSIPWTNTHAHLVSLALSCGLHTMVSKYIISTKSLNVSLFDNEI